MVLVVTCLVCFSSFPECSKDWSSFRRNHISLPGIWCVHFFLHWLHVGRQDVTKRVVAKEATLALNLSSLKLVTRDVKYKVRKFKGSINGVMRYVNRYGILLRPQKYCYC